MRGKGEAEMEGHGGRRRGCDCSKAAKESTCDDARRMDGAKLLWCGVSEYSDAQSAMQ